MVVFFKMKVIPMNKDAVIVIKIEHELKEFLQSVSDEKGITLSEYTRFVIGRGLDAIHQRNLAIRQLGNQLNV